ncbi:MAG: amidohydrolase family protein [Oscillospiraceae bacterium]|nr:amidohydrolase family protein [Oscillospiraceae bacterium]
MLVKKIDIHVHACLHKCLQYRLDPTFYEFPTPDELRKMYDKMGIEKGVQLPVVKPEAGLHQITNEESYEMVQQHPDLFDWFCCIDPRFGWNSEDTDFTPILNSYKAFGAKGIGEMLANMYFDDPRVWNLFRHAEKCQMPVTFHIGNMGGDYGLVDELGLPRLEKTLKEFPNLIFLGHSQKFWAEISGDCTEEGRDGYPEGPVTPGGRVVELMRKYKNLHGDLSAGSAENAIMRDPEFGYAFLEEFQDRLYFGTDVCDPRNEFHLSKHLDDAVESGKISQEAYNKICRENALRLLNGELYK